MDYFGRIAGVATLALGAAALSACYAPEIPPPAEPAVATGPAAAPVYPAAGYADYGSTAPVAPAPSYAGTTTIVAPYAPPPERMENPPPSSSPLAVWAPGHWSWNGTQFVWDSGHYVMRPSATATWHPGYWQQGPAGWTWIDGSWG
jgi:WXXGXW repeat (2 copies)